MIPSRGLARVGPGLLFQNQILSRAPVRSIPRQAISRPSTSSPRHFGTSLRSNGALLPRSSIGSQSARRTGAAGAAGFLSSQSILLSNRRFASTDSANPSPSTTSESTADAPGFSSISDLEPSFTLNFPEQPGYLANLGLDYGSGPTSMCSWVMEHIHFDLGVPWWGAIVGVALVTRIVMFYPALLGQLSSHKTQEMRKDPVFASINDRFTEAMTIGNVPPHELAQLSQQTKYLRQQAGIKMSHMFLPLLQIPFAYGMFKLTRAMANLPVPGLETAGILWFTDLTVADPYYILPCVSTILMYLSMKLAMPFMNSQQAAMGKIIPWVIGPISIIVTIGMPAAIQVYFASAAGLQYLQSMALHTPFIRTLCGLPQLTRGGFEASGPGASRTPSSPFGRTHASSSTGTYQAPRTISTTATESSSSETTPAASSTWSPKQMVGKAKKSFMDSSVMKKQTAKQAFTEAQAAEAEARGKELEAYRKRVARQQKRAGRK